jgi:hypothetical protein
MTRMSNLIKFPARSRPQPVSPHEELAALELELVRARLAQVRSETRYANALLFSHYVRKAVFWAVVLWAFSVLLK